MDWDREEQLLPVEEEFVLDGHGEPTQIDFIHPVTKQLHTVVVRTAERVDLRELGEEFISNWPPMCFRIEYSIRPDLPDGERLYLKDLLEEVAFKDNKSMSVDIVMLDDCSESGQEIGAQEACSAGVILSGDGESHSVTSKLQWELPDSFKMRIVGIFTEKRPAKTIHFDA